MKSVTEKEIESEIITYLNTLPWCFCWKNNNVGIFDPRKKVYRLPRSKHFVHGVSDIVGVYRGKGLFIEVKTPKTYKQFFRYIETDKDGKTHKHYKNQWEFITNVKARGAVAFVTQGIEHCIQELKQYQLKELSY